MPENKLLIGRLNVNPKPVDTPKEVMVINKHGRKVGCTYKFYMQHGRFNGLTLAEDISVSKAMEVKTPEVAEIVQPKITETKTPDDNNEESEIPEVPVKEDVVEEATFVCAVCGKMCKSKAALTNHLKTHSK